MCTTGDTPASRNKMLVHPKIADADATIPSLPLL
jgi:hypothetical protein